ncbi:MAG: hypothetical protein HQ450_07005 [Alcaligenaceae bacterium]|nr:hypothetical protein [Alcaligenaceae bacterium]
MPLPRSIPAGQAQFTAQRYRSLLEQRGQRVPASLKKLAAQVDAQPELLLAQIQLLERARLVTQADYLTIRTAARLRVLRGSGQTEARTPYGSVEADRQRLKRTQQKLKHTQAHEQAIQAWANGGRFAVYSAVMKELPADQVILADQLLMDLMNKQPCLDAAQYQLMLLLVLKPAP